MTLHYELPVYRDIYQLALKIFELTKHFSKDYKYTIGQDLKRDVLQLLRGIYRANKSQRKRECLDILLDDFELLKVEMRLCIDLGALPIKKQAQLSLLMESIGKQLTGWRKASLSVEGQSSHC